MIPFSRALDITPIPLKLSSASGAPIATHGIADVKVQLPGLAPRLWTFVVAAVQHSFLGADFLKATGLLLDLRNRRLASPNMSVPLHVSGTTALIGDIHFELPHALRPDTSKSLPPPQHSVVHQIPMTGHPVFAAPR